MGRIASPRGIELYGPMATKRKTLVAYCNECRGMVEAVEDSNRLAPAYLDEPFVGHLRVKKKLLSRLEELGCVTFGDVARLNESDIVQPGFISAITVFEVTMELRRFGLHLGMTDAALDEWAERHQRPLTKVIRRGKKEQPTP
jgi:hypothetical protein